MTQQFDHNQATPAKQPRALGGCLMTWVVVAIIVNVLLVLLSLGGSSSSMYDPIQLYPALAILLSAATIVGYLGILRFKKWGYYLVLAMYVLVTIIRFVIIATVPTFSSRGIGAVFSGIIGAVIFFALIQNVIRYFD